MVVRLDRTFFERVEQSKRNTRKTDLKKKLLQSEFFDGSDDARREAFETYFEQIWADASDNFSFNYPVNIQKYVLIILTQSKWCENPLHYQYARVMIGQPDRPWRLESGIRAVYHNIIRQHYLGDDLIAFIDQREDP